MSESKKQTSSGTQSRPDSTTGQRERIDGVLTIGGILDEQSLRMVVGGAAVETRSGWDLALGKGA